MATLKKYNSSGEAIGEVFISEGFINLEINQQLVKDYLVALRNNLRQWSANTRGRSEVNHSNQKPHRQKGTGNARQGTFSAPQYKGGGVVFGPKPKFDQKTRINRKERRAAIRYLISNKIAAELVYVVEDQFFNQMFKKPQTKGVVAFLKTVGIVGKKVLFLGESAPGKETEGFIKSMRNIPRTAYRKSSLLNGYDLSVSGCIVVTESGLQELVETVGGKNS
ncbi:MAG: 50S ribosomal protein L4 [Chlamydiia bacterium]|nr:50S ribosomal protein L4 [Chlamydiia bacterium]